MKSSIFTLTALGTAAILWAVFSASAAFIFIGLLSGVLFLNVTLSTMTNALLGAAVDRNDTFWRVVLMFVSALFVTIGVMTLQF